jgi:hypothetical protein
MKITIFAFVSLIICFSYSEIGSFSYSEIESPSETKDIVVPLEIDHEREIRETLIANHVDPYVIELLVAQSKHESGNYKNNLTKYHNVFARHYHKSDTLAISAGARAEGHSNFAIYPSIKNATISQINYLKRKGYSFNWKNPHQFALELKNKGYYQAPVEEYSRGLRRHMLQ